MKGSAHGSEYMISVQPEEGRVLELVRKEGEKD
jgi:hypothetical protein